MQCSSRAKTIFITGTDTGVGKTLLTALLLVHLRQLGHHGLAIKPFCSGSRADAETLHSLQSRELALDQINPFYFPEPLAPLVAARKHHRSVALDDVFQHIRSVASRRLPINNRSSEKLKTQNLKLKTPPYLLVEGAGGLLVPLGEGYTWADLILKLACDVIVVSANRLGTINHTLLTVRALQALGYKRLRVVIMDVLAPRRSTPDTRYNPGILARLLPLVPVHRIPFLGHAPLRLQALKKNQRKLKKVLARILA